jgi:hypothetical protein
LASIVGRGFSCASTVPFCSARYTSAKAIGVGLAPTARGNIIISGASGTRSFMPFMSSGLVTILFTSLSEEQIQALAHHVAKASGSEAKF